MGESFKSHQADSRDSCVLIIETLDQVTYHIGRHCNRIDYCHCCFRKIIKRKRSNAYYYNANIGIPSL